jgi:hypothetical protein
LIDAVDVERETKRLSHLGHVTVRAFCRNLARSGGVGEGVKSFTRCVVDVVSVANAR